MLRLLFLIRILKGRRVGPSNSRTHARARDGVARARHPGSFLIWMVSGRVVHSAVLLRAQSWSDVTSPPSLPSDMSNVLYLSGPPLVLLRPSLQNSPCSWCVYRLESAHTVSSAVHHTKGML